MTPFAPPRTGRRPTRRNVLRAAGVSLAGLSGCATDSEDQPKLTQIVDLLALNYTTEPRNLHLRIDPDDGSPWQTTVRVSAGRPTDAGERPVQRYPTEPGYYAVTAWLDGHASDSESRLDLRTLDAPCYALRVLVEDIAGDSGPPNVTVGAVSVECGTTTTTR